MTTKTERTTTLTDEELAEDAYAGASCYTCNKPLTRYEEAHGDGNCLRCFQELEGPE